VIMFLMKSECLGASMTVQEYINGDTPLTLSLELVKHPRILER
jgi:hypothetical protein